MLGKKSKIMTLVFTFQKMKLRDLIAQDKLRNIILAVNCCSFVYVGFK